MFKQNRNLVVIALIAVVNALGYGIIIPILYSYSKKYGLTDFQNGLLFAAFSIAQFLSTPVIGRMSDKFGRRPLLIISLSGTALSFILMAFAPNALFLFLARILDGITAGNIPVASAVISDTTKPEDRAKGFGVIGASFGFGFVFGPAISALTVGYSTALPFIIAAAVSIIAVIMTTVFLSETNQHMGEVAKGKLFDFAKLWHALFDPSISMTLIITLIYSLAFACAIIYGFQPFTKNILHITDTQNALLFTLFGGVGLVTQFFIVTPYTKYFGTKKAFSSSLFLTAVGFLLMYWSHNLWFFVFASVILGLFNGIVQTLLPTILSQEVDAKSQGSIMGINASYQSIGMIFGPILGGVLATVAIPYPLLAGTVITLFCFALSFHVLKPGLKVESAF